ncbi:Hypothetical predicted protein [Cloeon dipterum]|uniref:Peptidase S1 domain-containing protein n=1 Tax=Cloeon dipterum TaxID=197152 RepID=A0A8S1DYC1_9INSE|nr:Hypothetical predicted protein [Cloeon dipterum]
MLAYLILIITALTARQTKARLSENAMLAAQVNLDFLYFGYRSGPRITTTMSNVRNPVDTSAITPAQFDKIRVRLRPRGDGIAIKGRRREPDAGKLPISINNEIDKRNPLKSGHFPWHAGINADGKHFCAGAMISSRHIITVAHCVKGFLA